MGKRLRTIILRLIGVMLVASWVAAGLLAVGAYQVLARTQPGCPDLQAYTPAEYPIPGQDVTAPYMMPDYETVIFPSRGTGIDLSAFYIPAADDPAAAPAVIIVHGVAACKNSPNVLLPAGMLHRHGFNALVLDLRDHGASGVEDSYHAAATEEYLDVLGAWDWLVHEVGIAPDRIGLFGYSMGGAAVILAAAEEPQVVAIWTDSAFADVEMIIDGLVESAPGLAWLKPLSLAYGRWVVGDDLLVNKPVEAVARLDKRPLFMVHGDADPLVGVEHAYALLEAYPAAELWVTSGSSHVESIYDNFDTYERRLVAFFERYLQHAAEKPVFQKEGDS